VIVDGWFLYWLLGLVFLLLYLLTFMDLVLKSIFILGCCYWHTHASHDGMFPGMFLLHADTEWCPGCNLWLNPRPVWHCYFRHVISAVQ
jgi:hypothetical protein